MAPELILGWEEWVSLPGLGLPAIKAKIDTGARTSALHASFIEPFGPADKPMVRFVVHPRPGREDSVVVCAAPVVDRREVTSSNGESEVRYVIVTDISVGGVTWPIEVSLTDRSTMSYRMLIGRKAIRSDMFVDAATSFRQPRLSFKLYGHAFTAETPPRPLRFAVLTLQPDASTVQRLAEAATARGHAVELIDMTGDLAFTFSGALPGLAVAGRPLGHYDVIVPRLGPATPQLAAAVRQMEMMGAKALNSANALDRLRNPFARAQALAKAGIPASAGLMLATEAEAPAPVSQHATMLSFLVVGGRDIAVMDVAAAEPVRQRRRHHAAAAKLARRAAAALRMGLAAVDVAITTDAQRVSSVSAMPRLRLFQRICKVDVMASVVEAGEKRVRGRSAALHLPPPALK